MLSFSLPPTHPKLIGADAGIAEASVLQYFFRSYLTGSVTH